MNRQRPHRVRTVSPCWTAWLFAPAILAWPAVVPAQPFERIAEPETLLFVLPQLFGSEGLFVDSRSHQAHFNASFEDGFAPMNMALGTQLATTFVPPPVTTGGYGFDSTGLFQLSQQTFGVILSERPELIGRGELGFGFSMQHASYSSLDGMELGEIHTVFTHDNPELGGIRSDIVSAVNAIEARQSQFIGFASYGLTNWLDIALAVPVVTTELNAMSLATLHRYGSDQDHTTHFFEEETDPLGTTRLFGARGRATGLGDVTVRVKGLLPGQTASRLGLGLDLRLPTGDPENLLGTGAPGLRPFAAWSLGHPRFSPHASVSYQWNGRSLLAGSLTIGDKADLSDEIGYSIGAAVAVSRRVNITVDVLGRYILDALRMTSTEMVSVTGERLPTILFREGGLHSTHAAIGVTSGSSNGLRAHASLLFKLDNNGLRDTVVPLGGVQYGF